MTDTKPEIVTTIHSGPDALTRMVSTHSDKTLARNYRDYLSTINVYRKELKRRGFTTEHTIEGFAATANTGDFESVRIYKTVSTTVEI